LVDSSWMVLVFGFPIFMAYGSVFKTPLSFYLLTFVGFFCLLVITTSFGIVVVQSLVKTFPVRRLRDLFVFIGLLVFVGVYLLFRMLRPEEFLNPEGFATLMDYLSVRSESGSLLLPTTWLTKTVVPYITGSGHEEILFYFALLVLGAASAYRLAGHYHEAAHFAGYSKAVESKGAKLSKSRLLALISRVLHRWFIPSTAQLVVKEVLLMARDWGRLSQLLLLTSLVIVYLYNFSVLPSLDTPTATLMLKKTVAFLNIGLAGFVLSSLGVRFIFPAVSSEGRAFWILKGSPVGLRKILMVKYFFYLTPMVILGLFLVTMTNRILGMTGFMVLLSTLTVVLLTVGITSLALGMGVVYADLKEVDPNRVFSGFGGLVTMLYSGLAVSAVILLEAYPVYRVMLAEHLDFALGAKHYAMIGACLVGVVAVILCMIIQPLRKGLRGITELEI
jgi:ABC-2 type transport system permease protein